MKKITFYSKENCSLCEKGIAIIHELKNELDFHYEVVDIYKDDVLLEKFQIMIPVVEIDNEVISYGVLDKNSIRNRLL
ncbi:glutaredoxin family protein [Metabacillus endolithicus]|uniref:Glutaredoxin family protein n=1 Tax=Metabacillus endolithicus TaxID=1535204 RepID=A0ABW5C180_9BACI|nr:glutaredoxin family protein [Metabacillus endolithicus]UPG65240.1 glutaredoxin family protein [Metabacillus endolithicus]